MSDESTESIKLKQSSNLNNLFENERSLKHLILQHREIMKAYYNDNCSETERCASLMKAREIINKSERLERKMKQLERSISADHETRASVDSNYVKSGDNDSTCNQESPEKLAYLGFLNMEPRYLHDGLPTNRKSKRRPAPKPSFYVPDCNIPQRNVKRTTRKRRESGNVVSSSSSQQQIPSPFCSLTVAVGGGDSDEYNRCDSDSVPTISPIVQPFLKISPSRVKIKDDHRSCSPSPKLKKVVDSKRSIFPSKSNCLMAPPTLTPSLSSGRRFITWVEVACSKCGQKFAVHKFNSPGNPSASPVDGLQAICLACKVSAELHDSESH